MPVMLFLLYVIVEVTALVWVGSAIGVLATVGLLVVGSVLGAMLLRREGSRTLGALRAALASGRRPEREVADGLLVALGGLLLVVPGLVTGVLGILLLLPPVRVLGPPAAHRGGGPQARRGPGGVRPDRVPWSGGGGRGRRPGDPSRRRDRHPPSARGRDRRPALSRRPRPSTGRLPAVATQLLIGGHVYTPDTPDATALAVTDGTVVWVGQDRPGRALHPDAELVELDGALVTPGFVDCHVHATSAGLVLLGLDLSGARSAQECLALVTAHADAHPDDAVVWGHGWDDSGWTTQRPPSRAEVDACAPGRPIYLSRVDVHSALVSTALLEVAPAARTEPGFSTDGPLVEQAHHQVRDAARARLGDGQRHRAQRALLDHAAASGVVAVHECGGHEIGGVDDFRELLTLGLPGGHGVEVRGYWGEAVTSEARAREVVAETGAHALGGDLFVDGSLGSRTAWLTEPFRDDPHSAANCGTGFLGAAAIAAHLVACSRAGVQGGFHVIGDAGVAAVVDGVARAVAELGGPAVASRGHRLEHLEMVDAEQAAAIAAAGVLVSVQPVFDALWGGPDGLYAQRLGPERGVRLNPLATLASAGVGLALGSDAPVTPLDPWAAVRAAVHHRTPGQGISPRAAFTAATRGAWRAGGCARRRHRCAHPGCPCFLRGVGRGRPGRGHAEGRRRPLVHRSTGGCRAAARSDARYGPAAVPAHRAPQPRAVRGPPVSDRSVPRGGRHAPVAARGVAAPAARGAAALVAGYALCASFPPRHLWWLAPLGIALLVLVLRDRGPRAGFGYGYLAGLGFLVPLLPWIGVYVGPLPWLALAGVEALFVGLFGSVATQVGRLPGGPFWVACAWLGVEALRSYVPFGGFPWGRLAFGQPDGLLLPLASLGGPTLLSFGVALTGTGLAALLARCWAHRSAPTQLRHPTELVAACGAAVALLAPLLGALALGPTVRAADTSTRTLTVAAVQGNVPRLGLDFNSQRRAVLDNHVARTEQLARDVAAGTVPRPDVVVWPENASDIDPLRNPDATAQIDRVARAIGVPILVGAVLINDDDRTTTNSVIVWDPVTGPGQQHDKGILQPFGEYLPYRSFFSRFSSYADRAGYFVPGDDNGVLTAAGVPVSVATCWEVAFDRVIRGSVADGAQWIAIPTNNATFGRTEMTYQQLAMSRVRAVENGRAVVVAATSGGERDRRAGRLDQPADAVLHPSCARLADPAAPGRYCGDSNRGGAGARAQRAGPGCARLGGAAEDRRAPSRAHRPRSRRRGGRRGGHGWRSRGSHAGRDRPAPVAPTAGSW